MDLYIHFGIYKTGSSFLQTMCAQNRELLANHAYFFPASERENDMMAGRISPGNGRGLDKLLKRGNVVGCTELLGTMVVEARKNNCNKLLISSEALIHTFANVKSCDMLFEAIKSNGIKDIHCLGFFRNPVDHALSTFKHRAKKGGIKDFKSWVQNKYETMRVLGDFFSICDKYPVKWSFRRYKKDSIYLADVFFSDWLGFPRPKIPKSDQVNVSMTLSEIYLIQQTAEHIPEMTRTLREIFSQLPIEKKANDRQLGLFYRQQAQEYLQQFLPLMDEINARLPKGENLSLELYEKPMNVSAINAKDEAVLTKDQLKGFLLAVKKNRSRVLQIKRYLKKVVNKYKAKTRGEYK